MSDVSGIIVCRSDPAGLARCVDCGRPVAVSPAGRQRITEVVAAGGSMAILCNPCGARIMDTLNAKMQADPALQADIEIMPAAWREIERRESSLAAEIRKRAAAQGKS